MTFGGTAAGRDAGSVARAPWPNAAERAAARRAAQEALAGSRARREVEARAAEEAEAQLEAQLEEPIAPLAARPRIEDDESLLGLTRRSNSRVGQRVFNLFFLFVFLLIAIQMVVALLAG
ncbi:hypothetical protein [Pseudonocardia sp.]|uniref:hypothetical protein n=1 Tax=Pseudonocardia sp. TaxID=60912 RepID=UPI003D0A4CAE